MIGRSWPAAVPAVLPVLIGFVAASEAQQAAGIPAAAGLTGREPVDLHAIYRIKEEGLQRSEVAAFNIRNGSDAIRAVYLQRDEAVRRDESRRPASAQDPAAAATAAAMTGPEDQRTRMDLQPWTC